MGDIAGFLTRSTGIVATLLAVTAMVWGFVFSARATGKRLRPAWWLDLHNWLGGLALIFTGVHIVLSIADSGSGIGFVQAFVPGTAPGDRLGIGTGVVATYLFALAVFTTWPRRLKKKYLWRVAHLGSVLGAGLALLHGYLSGSDSTRLSMQAGIVICALLGTYAGVLRVMSMRTR